MSDYFRKLVSGRKKRFIQDGYNLDLTYITDRILAMAYPAQSSVHKTFRNDINEVYSFFEKYHSNHWKILNVAMEISYSSTKVGGNVIVMGFEDHSPPPFLLLLEIIEKIDQWLKQDEQNVIAVHCKAGKGRTGTIISSYLIYMMSQQQPEVFYTSDSILFNTVSFFNEMRANDSQCITVPSQKRYIGYYIQYLRGDCLLYNSLLLNPPQFKISNIDVIDLFSSNSQPHFNIEIHLNYNPTIKNLPIILRGSNTSILYYQDHYSYILNEKNIIVKGDTLIRFNSLDSHQCIFRFIFHTAFLPIFTDENGLQYTTLLFKKDNLDGGSGGCFIDNRFRTDFSIRLLLNFENNNNYNNNNNNNNNNLNNNNGNENIILRKAPPPPISATTTTTILQQPILGIPPQVPCRSKKPVYEQYQL